MPYSLAVKNKTRAFIDLYGAGIINAINKAESSLTSRGICRWRNAIDCIYGLYNGIGSNSIGHDKRYGIGTGCRIHYSWRCRS